MELIYLSALSSERLINEIYNNTKNNPGFAVQKFSRLLVKGLLKNDINCVSLSVPPITRDHNRKSWISLKNEFENGVEYRYIPFINFPILKQFSVFIYSFFYILAWGMKNRADKAIVCDVLCVSSSISALIASKICGVKSVAVVTDIYSQMVGEKSSGAKALISKFAGGLNSRYVRSFSKYVLLTEAMNEVVNPKGRPYVVMEALCDSDLVNAGMLESVKTCPKVLVYAGGLEEQYGIKMLVEAFKKLPHQDVELHIYGNGSYVDELKQEADTDKRIMYLGVVSNEKIVEAELKATLLINPRFTTEEFTKYSFPSKNMEYMVSGTPLLTTKLPGMPVEYYPYVYLFDEETVDGYSQSISNVLSKTDDELKHLGMKARDFVLKKKNNVLQAKKIIDLINFIEKSLLRHYKI